MFDLFSYLLCEKSGGGGIIPSGTINITENGSGIDIAQYAEATINVQPSSKDFIKVVRANSRYILNMTWNSNAEEGELE